MLRNYNLYVCKHLASSNKPTVKLCPECKKSFSDEISVCPHDGTILVRPKKQADKLIGKTIDGKYRVIERIAGGGMGSVYRAEHTMMQRVVAIKLLHPHLAEDADDEQFLLRFQREARTASQINHPNAVTIFDFGVFEEQAYLVMQYLEGQSLRRLLEQRKRLQLRDAVGILSQIGSAVQCAHDAGIVHRDLKPDNIMVSERPAANHSNSYSAVVLDFGIAKVLRGDSGISNVTKTGKIIGTPQYMAPEQVLDLPVDARTDVYSLGVILFELLTGEIPFTAESAMQLMMKHVNETPRPLKESHPELRLPPAVVQVLMQALEKKPENRPRSASKFIEELERAEKTSASEMLDSELIHATLAEMDSPTKSSLPTQNPLGQEDRKIEPKLESRSDVLDDSDDRVASVATEVLAKSRAPRLRLVLLIGVLLVLVISKLSARLTEKGGQGSGISTQGQLSEDDRLKFQSEQILNEGKPELAIEILEKRVIAAPNSAAAQANLGRIFHRIGKLTEAISQYQKALEIDPNYDLAVYNLGHCYYRLGKFEDANRWLEKAAKLKPESGDAHKFLAETKAKLGDFEAAGASFAEAARLLPNDASIHYQYGLILAQQGSIPDAIREYQKAVEINPNDSRTQTVLGATLGLLGRNEEALEHLQKALKINSNNPDTRLQLGMVLAVMQKFEEAILEFREALKLNPNFVLAHQKLSQLLLQLSRYDEAVPVLQEAIRSSPDEFLFHHNLGWALNSLGRFSEAVPVLEDAIKINATNPVTHYYLGTAFGNLGKFSDAKEALIKAVELNPDYSVAHYNLAKAYQKLGELDRAQEHYKQAQRLAPGASNRQEAVEQAQPDL